MPCKHGAGGDGGHNGGNGGAETHQVSIENAGNDGFVPKVMLQMVIKSSEREAVMQAITEAARSGEVGDGKIFVYPISSAVRIRTGDTGQEAL